MPRLRFVSTVQGVNSIELSDPIITIGRVENNVVCIEDPNISKHHTLLVSEDASYKIYDLHSVNGTWINGERITAATLKEGDAVRIGYLELKYESSTPVVGSRPLPVVPAAPAAATVTAAPITPRTPPVQLKDDKRAIIQVPALKKVGAPLPPPPPPPAAPAPLAKPAAATATEEPAAGPRKLGAAPGGGPPKFKLRRE